MSGEIGYGTTLGYSTTQNGSYTDVDEVTEITLPNIEINDVDKSHLLSTDYFREFTPGMGNSGEITFKVLFEKVQQAALYALIRTSRWWRVQFPLADGESSPSDWKCSGYIKAIQNMNPIDDKMEAEFKIKFTGKPAFAQGS